MKHTQSFQVSLGGVLAALAICIMSLGTWIPVATYVCPLICLLLLQTVFCLCGRKIAWAWYGAVAILACLLSPDKEAAAVFVFLGYYPILKPYLDRMKCAWLWKAALFQVSIAVMYWLLITVLGISEITESFSGLRSVVLAVMLILGNITFFLTDRVLEKPFFRKLEKYGK